MFVTNSETTRAYVKIQDGCNNYCSYCIIPYVRGNIRSKDINVAIEEINGLVSKGYKEIVFTGINTGAYGKETSKYDLTDLIREISKIDKLERIRVSSIEITEITDKFIEELKTAVEFTVSDNKISTVSGTSAYIDETDTNNLTLIVENVKGYELPKTGGIGTILIETLGIAIVLSGVYILKKRK